MFCPDSITVMVERALKINYLSLIIVLFVLSFFRSPRSITVRCSLFFPSSSVLFFIFYNLSMYSKIYIFTGSQCIERAAKKKKHTQKTHVCGGIWCILTAISAQLSVTLKHLFLSYDQRAYGAFMCNTQIYIYMLASFVCVCGGGGGGEGGHGI